MNEGERSYLGRRGSKAGPRSIDGATLAIESLTFLGSDPDQAQRFFALSGLDAGTIRAAVTEPGFLSVVLDFLTSDDKLLERFAAHAGQRAIDVAHTAQALREREAFSG